MIKNIIFDVGNVIVKWSPFTVIAEIFPNLDPKEFYEQIKPIWLDLNLGKLSEKEAVNIYHQEFNIPKSQLDQLLEKFKTHQLPVAGSIELLEKLKQTGVNLYAITDNVKEIMEYHKNNSNFLHYFKDVIVSADICILKPDIRIYQYLLDKHNLKAEESLFIDDTLRNVEGAIAAGMKSFQFIDAKDCEELLVELSVLQTNQPLIR